MLRILYPIKNYFLKSKKQKAFSLTEVLIAIFIIVIGIVSAVNLMTFNISKVAISKSQIIASNLNQEGMGIVRNIRDSNWIEQRYNPTLAWDDGLAIGDYQVQYNSLELIAFTGQPLKINANGFYQYSSGDNSLFHRKIIISNNPDEDPATEDIGVVCEITWSERGHSHTISAENRLYNWK